MSTQQVHSRIDHHFNAICQLCGVFSIIVNSFLNFQGLLSPVINNLSLISFCLSLKKVRLSRSPRQERNALNRTKLRTLFIDSSVSKPYSQQ